MENIKKTLPPARQAQPPSSFPEVHALPARKFRSPVVPPLYLVRDRLHQTIRQWPHYRVTTVTAPAGFGKSTLAAAALAGPATPGDTPGPAHKPIWLALDEDDDDDIYFMLALSTALSARLPEAAAAAHMLAYSQHEPRRAMAVLLAAVEKLPEPVLLVLDDFHRLQSQSIRQLLVHAFQRSPDNLHWMVLSRPPLDLNLARLHLADAVLAVPADELRLTRHELEEYLTLAGVHFQAQTAVEQVNAHTQGWFAVVQLMLLALRRTNGPVDLADPQFLLQRLNGTDDLVAEYLAGEVLAQLPERQRAFLLRCAILDRLHPDICTAVTDDSQSARRLQQLHAQHIFLRVLEKPATPLAGPEDLQTTGYELHGLFRELLLHHLRLEETPTAIQGLYRRAADWYLAQGEILPAVRALVAGSAPHLAAEIVQERSHAAFLNNQLAELRQWIKLLPEAQLHARPRLLLDLAWVGLSEPIEQFETALTQARAALAPGKAISREWQDELAALALYHRYLKGTRPGLYQDLLEAAAGFDPASHLAIGYTHYLASFVLSEGTIATALDHARRAGDAFEAAGYQRGRLLILAHAAHSALFAGSAAAVMAHTGAALQLLEQQPHVDPYDAITFVLFAGEALYLQNRCAEAAAYFRRGIDLAQTYRDPLLLLQASAAYQLCVCACPDEPPLPVILDEEALWQEGIQLYSRGAQCNALLWQMRHRLAGGHQPMVWERFRQLDIALASLTDDEPYSVWLAFLTDHVARGEALEQITPALDMLLRRTEGLGAHYLAIQFQILRIRQLHQLGQRDAARSLLRRTLRLVEETGLARFILDAPDLMGLLHLTKTEYADRLQAMGTGSDRGKSMKLSRRESTLLELLAQGMSNGQIAERLVISPTTARAYISRLYDRLGVRNRAEAVAWARKRPSSRQLEAALL